MSASILKVPAGNYNGSFSSIGSNSNFWTSTENSSSNAYNRNFNTGTSMESNNNNKNNEYSVRLVKDPLLMDGHLTRDSLFKLLYKAYREARRNKRNTSNQLKFEIDLEYNLLKLTDELLNRSYSPKPSICFIKSGKVKREVVAADFRDRVVHHLVCSWLFPIFERQFIYDSYSCRKGKGTLFGVNRSRKFINRVLSKSEFGYSLRLDIKGFFMHIDKSILYDLIINGLNRSNWINIPDRSLCEFLIKLIVFSNPIKNAIIRSPEYYWKDLPSDKSLRHASNNKGLPIGNLTSQLFANIYLNPLDQFIKRKLKIKNHGRYVDDMVLISPNKDELLKSIRMIRSYLSSELGLILHPKKIRLQSIHKGFQFLGCYVLPNRVYPTKSMRVAIKYSYDLLRYQSQLYYLNGLN